MMNKKESREDYLEAILVLERKNKRVISIDIANELSFSKPSVSIAMKKLKDEGLITVDDDGTIHLTKKGRMIAEKTLEKHEFLTDFFIYLGVDPLLAEDEACSIEHSLGDETFEKFRQFVMKVRKE